MSRHDGEVIDRLPECEKCDYQNVSHCYWGAAIKKLTDAVARVAICQKRSKPLPRNSSFKFNFDKIPVRLKVEQRGVRVHLLQGPWGTVMEIVAPNGDHCSIKGPKSLSVDYIPLLPLKCQAVKAFMKQHNPNHKKKYRVKVSSEKVR